MNDDLKLIQQGLEWLVRFQGYESLDANRKGGQAQIYAAAKLRVISRMKTYTEQHEDKYPLIQLITALPQPLKQEYRAIVEGPSSHPPTDTAFTEEAIDFLNP